MRIVKRTGTLLLVIIASAGIALANSIGFFTGIAQAPAGSVYLGTVHYWEDYFFYLNHFFQGASGAWLVANRYTNEATPDSLLYWSNLLMGKAGGLFGLSPILSYNVSLIVFSFVAITLSYVLISRLVFPNRRTLSLFAFMVTWLGTSMINRVRSSEGPMIFWPFQIWKTPHFAFDRLGGAPHQMVQTILFYGLLTCSVFALRPSPQRTWLKWSAGAVMAGILLASINPVQAGMFLGSLWFATVVKSLYNRSLPSRTTLVTVVSVSAGIALTMLTMMKLLATQPHIQTKIWEAAQQSGTTWPFLFLSLGPVMVILAVLGAAVRIRKLEVFDSVGLAMLGFGYFFFMFTFFTKRLEVANVRVLFPVNHIFWGVFAAYGADWVSRRVARIGLTYRLGLAILTVLFLITTLPTLTWELSKKTVSAKDRGDLVVYLPVPLYEAFSFLKDKRPYNDTVLADAGTHLDTLVPALSGHTTYSGHILTTTRNSEKQAESAAFFRGEYSAGDAQAWLREHRIRYILFTRVDGDLQAFLRTYPFLNTAIYANPDAVIYSYGGQ